jgi:Flp pilus assembly protein TadG
LPIPIANRCEFDINRNISKIFGKFRKPDTYKRKELPVIFRVTYVKPDSNPFVGDGAAMLFDRFVKDCRGGVAPTLALTLVPLMAGMGAAVDYSRANSARTAMQAALDSTVLMLSKNAQTLSSPEGQATAQDYFNAIFSGRDVQNLQISATASTGSDGTAVTGTASGSVKTTMMSALGFSALDIAVRSKALTASDDLGCVLSLDSAAAGATTAGGSTTVNLSNCSLYDNSNNLTALTVTGSATVNALSVGVVGGVSGNASIYSTQGIHTGMFPIRDPYADVVIPSFGACTENKFSAKNTVTIDPGVYCNGVTFNAGADVTLNPGVYYLDRGKFAVNGGATIKGQGVTLVFTSSTGADWATATINGGAVINLTPPQYGPTAGIVVMGDRGIPAGTAYKFNGGASQYFGGAIYISTGAIDFVGGSGTSTSCTQVIGGTVSFSGNSNLAVNCSSYKTKPFGATVSRLAL